MNVAFCVNRLALIGLGPTVSSLIINCSNSAKLCLWFLFADLTDEDKDNVKRLLSDENFQGKFNFIDINPESEFGVFRSLHGDWTAYSRLLLPELLQTEESILYLDSDLIVEVDVLAIEDFDLKGKALGAVRGSSLKYALENVFLSTKIGLSLDADYFNSGVLYFNLNDWRSKNLKEKCLEIAREYPMELLAVDQTILNAVFSMNYEKLPAEFNCPWKADNKRPAVAEKMILHFVGSPKPWDIFGGLLHSGYSTWVKYLNNNWSKCYNRKRMKELTRFWIIRRSYLRTVKSKLLNR